MRFIVSAVVRELIAAGVEGDALVAALERIEAASGGIPVDTVDAVAEKRRAFDRERKAKKRVETSALSGGIPVESGGTADIKKEIPHTPLEKTLPILEVDTRATPKARAVSRGTRLPDDFAPRPALVQQARNLGLTEQEIHDQLERFRDWANAATGQVSIKLDWQAAFRNWFKRAADDKRNRQGRNSKPTIGDKWRDGLREASTFVAGGSGHGAAPIPGRAGTVEPIHDLDPGQFSTVGD